MSIPCPAPRHPLVCRSFAHCLSLSDCRCMCGCARVCTAEDKQGQEGQEARVGPNGRTTTAVPMCVIQWLLHPVLLLSSSCSSGQVTSAIHGRAVSTCPCVTQEAIRDGKRADSMSVSVCVYSLIAQVDDGHQWLHASCIPKLFPNPTRQQHLHLLSISFV